MSESGAMGTAGTTGTTRLTARYDIPEAGAPQCEADGVRNGPDGPGGTEHYWSCTAPGTVDVDGILMCDDHAGERGHGPKQEDYGYDPTASAGTSRLTETDRDLITRAREIGSPLRRSTSDHDRYAGWLLSELADRLERLGGAR